MASVPEADRDHPTRTARRVARNTLFLAAADIANKLMMFVFSLIAARHLGVEAFGVFNFALAFVALFAVFTDLGLGSFTAREVARDHGKVGHYMRNILAIKLVTSLLVIGAIVVLVNLLGYPRSTVRVVYICCVFVVTSAVALYCGFVFQGLERMHFTAGGRVLQAGILLVGAVVLAHGAPRPDWYALLYIAAGGTAALFLFVAASRSSIGVGLSFDFREWRRILRAALPFGVSAFFVALYYWNGFVLLSKFGGDTAVGVYSAPFRLVMGTVFAGVALASAIYPLMSRMHVAGQEQLAQLLGRALRYAVVIAVPLGIIGTMLARPIISLVFGAGYGESVAVLRILAWWGACICLNALLSNYFFASNRARVVTKQTAVSLGVNVVLNFVLIPLLGVVGTAVAIVAAELTGTLFLVVQQKHTRVPVCLAKLAGTVLRAGAASGVAAAVGLLVSRWGAWFALASVVLGYVPLLVLFGGLNRGDIALLRRILRTDDAQ